MRGERVEEAKGADGVVVDGHGDEASEGEDGEGEEAVDGVMEHRRCRLDAKLGRRENRREVSRG
jgi:hypothetical protein